MSAVLASGYGPLSGGAGGSVDQATSVVLLTGSNWVSWSESMIVALKAKGLWSLVSGTKRVPTIDPLPNVGVPSSEQLSRRDRQETAYDVYVDRQNQAVGVIAGALSIAIRKATSAAQVECPKQLWDDIQRTYGATQNDQVSFIKRSISNKFHDRSECIREHHGFILGQYADLEKEGYIVPYYERCEALLSKLQPEWEDTVEKINEHFEERDATDRNIKDVQYIVNKFITKSLNRERNKREMTAAQTPQRGLQASTTEVESASETDKLRKELADIKALIGNVKSNPKRDNSSKREKGKSRTCDNCGKEEHVARSCPDIYSDEYIKKLGERYQPTHVKVICDRHNESIKKEKVENGKSAKETRVEFIEDSMEYCMMARIAASSQNSATCLTMPELITDSESECSDADHEVTKHSMTAQKSMDNKCMVARTVDSVQVASDGARCRSSSFIDMPELLTDSESESESSFADTFVDMPELLTDSESESESAFAGTTSKPTKLNGLFLDSGASSHMVGDNVTLVNCVVSPRRIVQLDGTTVMSTHVGEIVL